MVGGSFESIFPGVVCLARELAEGSNWLCPSSGNKDMGEHVWGLQWERVHVYHVSDLLWVPPVVGF